MYSVTKVLIIIVLAYCHTTMASAACQSLTELNWILGDWISKSEKTDTHESWHQLSELTFEGKGLSFNKQGQQTSLEDLRLLNMQGEIYYLAKVSHNPLPVAFKAISCDANQVVFENPHHDFPNRLLYVLKVTGSMEVTVSDLQGKGFTLQFQPNKKAD
jgi:hypothetical protein